MIMRRARFLLSATSLALIVSLLAVPGCGNGFLGLEDYQRDLLFGGLAAALLAQQQADAGGGVGQPVPGADGLHCWDLNGNGLGEPDEDINADGSLDAFDCQGHAGQDGLDGADGASGSNGSNGSNGVDGLSCWDLNGNRIAEPAEDINGDGNFTALDCRGPVGLPGSSGSQGPPGADGPEFFNVFVDDFFTTGDAANVGGSPLPVVAVTLDEPFLGTGGGSPIAYRMAVPDTYGTGNDVRMRMFFYRTGAYESDCFVFTVDARRLRAGSGIEVYGQRRWVRIDAPVGDNGGPATDVGLFVVVDLPVNKLPGLGYPNDLAGGDFLALEVATGQLDGYAYQLVGVEFAESEGGAALVGGSVFTSEDEVECAFLDCNRNGLPDDLDILRQVSFDCDENGIPDECATCPPVDLVFLMDTSGSMQDEGVALCDSINGIVTGLAHRGIILNHEILAIAPNDAQDLPPCVSGVDVSVEARYDGGVPGNNGTCPDTLTAVGDNLATEKDENWAPASAIIAERYAWAQGAIRIIVPISDEGACLGDSCDDPGRDRDAVDNAIAVANQHDVYVSPIAAGGSSACVIGLGQALAAGTGGRFFQSNEPAEDLATAIESIVTEICAGATDCNGNKIPDACERCVDTGGAAAPIDCYEDCNDNGTLDVCEIAVNTDAPGGPFFCERNCDPDVNHSGVPDDCEEICDCHEVVDAVCELGNPGQTASEGMYLTFEPPTMDEGCFFRCAGETGPTDDLCSVQCDWSPDGAYYPVGTTTVTCRSYYDWVGGVVAGREPVDYCSFDVNLRPLSPVCAGTFTGTYVIGKGVEGTIRGSLAPDGTVDFTFVSLLPDDVDLTFEGVALQCGIVALQNIVAEANLTGELHTGLGVPCDGGGSLQVGGVFGRWDISFE